MKVVLFCGGFGMRMRDGVTNAPKPMAMVGDRPLLWHVMRYYAHYGHTDFVLCLGYGASAVKDFFLSYDETGPTTSSSVAPTGRWSCSRPISRTGGSRSSIPACTPRSANGSAASVVSCRTRRCSSQTTRTSSPMRSCRT